MAQRSRFYDSQGSAITLATSAAADDIIDTTTPHGFTVGQQVHFTALTGGAGLTVGTIYFVSPTSFGANTFRVTASPGGADLGFTTDITAGTVVGGDRVYTSAAMAEVLSSMVSDGVVSTGNEMAVSENSPTGMSVRVNTGKIFIQGYFLEVHTAQEVLTIAAAHATLPRIDRVVARRDLTGRQTVLAVLTGTPAASPTAPALTQNVAGTYELPLAQIAVGAAVTSIVNANITDQRGARSRSLGLIAELLNATGHRHEGTDGTGRKVRHTDLLSIAANDHHNQSHGHTGADGSGTVSHANLTGTTADQHHARAHNHSSTSDEDDLVPASVSPTNFINPAGGTIHLTSSINPPTISADQNNYNPTGLSTATVIRQLTSGARQITGLTAQGAGRVIFFFPMAGSGTLTFVHESASSTAANRFACPASANLVVDEGQGIILWYDGTTQRWRIVTGAP